MNLYENKVRIIRMGMWNDMDIYSNYVTYDRL